MSTKTDTPVFTLPALRSLGDLAGAEPVIIIDTREQEPLPFSRLKTRAGSLFTGDYSVAGLESLFAVERKSISDLVGCCIGQNRERFERELHRLRGFRFKRLIIIGSETQILKGHYHSNIKPQAVMGTLHAFEVRYDVPVVFCETPELAARTIQEALQPPASVDPVTEIVENLGLSADVTIDEMERSEIAQPEWLRDFISRPGWVHSDDQESSW
jgi:DNA excision repair protein ERCC-4